MTTPLQFNHRLRIDILKSRGKFAKLDQYLEKLAGKNVDVAGVPFRLMDDVLSSGSDINFTALIPLARHTAGGQPRLLTATLKDLHAGRQDNLRQIVTDDAAHPMTRFEAMGWATYLTHKAAFPARGSQTKTLFQFWDQPVPPSEILEGKQLWQDATDAHLWYDDTSAKDYIAQAFGTAAADEYAALWHPALKSDVFRLYRLAKDGGVYSDADSKPQHRAAEFLTRAGDRVWASSMTNVPNCVAINGFMAAPAQSPLIEALLNQVLRNVRDVKSRGIFWLSGPGAFTTFLYEHGAEYDVGLLSQGVLRSDLFRQFDAGYKQTQKNWRVFEHKAGLDNKPGLQEALKQVEGAA